MVIFFFRLQWYQNRKKLKVQVVVLSIVTDIVVLFIDAKKLNLAELVKNADNAEGDLTDENSFGPGDARDFTVSRVLIS